MPLKDRDRSIPRRLVRLGVIRLGHKEKKQKTRQDGTTYEVEYPVQDDHFMLADAPDLAAFYEDMPVRELDVILPFPDQARNFDAFYEVWAGGVLICKGDGEQVQYAAPMRVESKNDKVRVYNAPGDTLVSNGTAQIAFTWNGTQFQPGDLVPCPGAVRNLYPHCAVCRVSAILKVLMADPQLFRLGYYQVATGSKRNYDTILGTLDLVSACGTRPVNGIQFKLRLVEEPTQYMENGQRKATKKWFLQLEPDPTITRALYQRQALAMLAQPAVAMLPEPEPDEDQAIAGEWDTADEPAPPPFAERKAPAEVEAPAEPGGNDKKQYTLQDFKVRYSKLLDKAGVLNMTVPPLPKNANLQQIKQAGLDLKAAIALREKAIPEQAQDEEPEQELEQEVLL